MRVIILTGIQNPQPFATIEGTSKKGARCKFLPPILLTKREEPFDDPRYLFEPKIDGHRQELSVQDGHLSLFTRHETLYTPQYPELYDLTLANVSDALLVGEVARMDPVTGAVYFESIM